MIEILFGMLMLGVGAWALIHMSRTRALLESSKRWSTTEGRITESRTKRIGSKKRTYEARIRYEYEVGGKRHEGKGLHIGGDVRRTRVWAEQRCADYPEGESVTVFYDPRAPESSCIIREREGAGLELVAVVAGFGLGAWLLFRALG